jgi:sec-independent protein translocase protein TatA
MLGLSGEHILVLLVILLIFGPKRLPELGHSIGRTMKNFKDALNGGGQESIPPAAQIPSLSNTVMRDTAPPTSSPAMAEKQAEKV